MYGNTRLAREWRYELPCQLVASLPPPLPPLTSLCEPGRTQRQPFSTVAGWRASQRPRQDWAGSDVVVSSVWRKVESWWEVTSPPIRGCLKMYIDWGIRGSVQPMEFTSDLILGEVE